MEPINIFPTWKASRTWVTFPNFQASEKPNQRPQSDKPFKALEDIKPAGKPSHGSYTPGRQYQPGLPQPKFRHGITPSPRLPKWAIWKPSYWGSCQSEEEITILSGFPRLKHLNLRDTGISDLSPLANLTDLEYLNLYSNYRIQSIAPLAGLTHLQTLILGDVPVGDKAKLLEGLTTLEHLNLRNTGIIDLSPLSELSHLRYLNLHSNPDIKSLPPSPA